MSAIWPIIRVWHLVALVLIAIVSLSFVYDDPHLVSKQDEMQWQLGDTAVNTLVHNYILSAGNRYYVITNYPWLKHLPGLDDHCEMLDMANDREFFKYIQLPEVTNILVTDSDIPKSVMRFIRGKLNSGEYKLIGSASGYFLLQVK